MCVDTEVSRSCIAATYDASTAPALTSSCPASSIAASRLLAVPPRTIELGESTSSSTPADSSATATAVPPPDDDSSISSTISSYRGLPMKLSTETWIADGVRCLARSVRS